MRIRLFDFLNTYPYQRALQAAGIAFELYPSPREVWEAWRQDPGDAALLPLASVAACSVQFSRWGIASRGPVLSVLLLSDYPPDEWQAIHVDVRSISSVRILQQLMKKGHLPKVPLHNDACDGQLHARLIIGDEALRCASAYSTAIDLGAIAYRTLRRGTVFAVWWAQPAVRALLSRLWRRYLPKAYWWSEEAARRYGFTPQLVRRYWGHLWYRLPPLGRRYWKRIFCLLQAQM